MKTQSIIKAKITLFGEYENGKFERELLFTDWESLDRYIEKYWEITEEHERSDNFHIFTFDPKDQSYKYKQGFVHASKVQLIDYKP